MGRRVGGRRRNGCSDEHDGSEGRDGLLFFFSSRRRHTRFDCDWSSDVCSSDLLKRFEAFAGRLERELGTEPAPETRALAAQVRLERTWRLPKAAAAEAKRAPLVGRARELGQLVEAWTTCRRGPHPAPAGVGGGAGGGETRPAAELRAPGPRGGAAVAGG